MKHQRIRSSTDTLLVLWRHRRGIVLAGVAAAAAAAAVSLILPRAYRATATMMISESKIGSDSVIGAHFNPRLYNTFEGIIGRREVLARVIEEFPALAEDGVVVDDLAQSVDVTLVANSRLLSVSVTLGDAELAADVANRIAAEAQAFTTSQLNEREVADVRARLGPALEEARGGFREAEARYAEATRPGSVQALEALHTNLLQTRLEIQRGRLPFVSALIAQRLDQASDQPLLALWQEAQDRLERHRRENSAEALEMALQAVWDVQRRLPREQGESQAQRAQAEGELAALGGASGAYAEMERQRLEQRLRGLDARLREAARVAADAQATGETINALHITALLEDERLDAQRELSRLDYEHLYSRSTPALEALVAGYDEQLAAVDASIEQVRSLIGRAMTEQLAAESELTIARDALSAIQLAVSETVMRLEEKNQGLIVVDHALPPHYAEFPRRKLMTLLAGALALFAACVFAVARENLLGAAEEAGAGRA